MLDHATIAPSHDARSDPPTAPSTAPDGGTCQMTPVHRHGIQRADGLNGTVLDGLRAARAPSA